MVSRGCAGGRSRFADSPPLRARACPGRGLEAVVIRARPNAFRSAPQPSVTPRRSGGGIQRAAGQANLKRGTRRSAASLSGPGSARSSLSRRSEAGTAAISGEQPDRRADGLCREDQG
jgi:hypothetical protein